MMKRVFIFLCIAVSASFSISAQPIDQNKTGFTQQPAQPIEAIIRASYQAITEERFEEAYQKASLALELSRSRGLKAREARASQLLALSSFYLGRTDEAIAYFKQAASLAGEADDPRIQNIQTTMLHRAGVLLWLAGRYNDALYCLSQALKIHRQRKDREGVASTLNKLSLIYSETGDFVKATQALNESLEIAKTSNDQALEASIWLRLVTVENARGNYEAALQIGKQALALEVNSSPATRPQTVVLGELLYRLGNAHHALNQYQMAIEKYDQALKLARDVHMPLFEAVVLGDFAETQLKTGNPEAALSSASLAISTLQSGGGSKHLESKFLNTIAESQKALGRIDDALSTYRQAITAIEQSRSHSIPTEISRAGIVAMRQKVFAGAIEFLVDQHRIAESLEVAEKYHARAFLDILAETGIDASEGISKENKEHEEKLFERISSIQKKIWQGRTSKPDQATESEQELKRQLRVAENDLESFQLELRRINPRYATIKYPQPIKPEQIADEILDSETAIIEFVLSDQRSVGWIIKKDRIDAVVLPARKEIESLIAEYREAFSGRVYSLTAGQAIAKVKAQSRVLYEKVFHPFEPYLANTKKLIIIPDGSLNYLPFETLTSEEKASANNHQRSSYLIERFAISYAPSITALARLNSINGKRATKAIGFIAFGDPQYTSFAAEGKESIPLVKRSEQGFEFRQLPWTRTEVNDVAGLFPATERKVFIGTEAKEENAKSETLAGYRYIHFAAHGMIDEDFPARSGIALTADAESKDDGILQMNEVMRLKLNADLVTLSACRTGLGKVMNGEGIVGLTRSFLYAGADSLLVSLWNVNDVATALLMKSFYANLQRGMSKSEALRQAKLELLSNQKRAWRHPYFWAAFVLVGLPK